MSTSAPFSPQGEGGRRPDEGVVRAIPMWQSCRNQDQ